MSLRSLSTGRANQPGPGALIRPQNDLRRKTVTRAAGLAIVSLWFVLASSWAQGPAPKTSNVIPQTTKEAASPASTPALTEADLRAFVDGIMPLQLERGDIAGAVVLVVKDGQILFAKGYGYADVAAKKPVTPAGTLFRPGSISKLFTWTAVMQLVEEGKLDLDRDVNSYLDFKIPSAFGKPMTLRNIMTHTSGFEETAKDLFVKDAGDMKPLDEYLKTHMPTRIFPPGEIPAYSNYATSVAGYIVQRVSGQPFNDYIAQHILKPLDMAHSTFVQPLPDALKSLMSSGYTVASQPAKPYEFVQAFPAGSSAVSAEDMSHFMIAHLQDGQYKGTRILKPETVALMHSRQFAYNTALNGMCLGFYEETRNGHRILGHAGDTVYFHSDLHLIPDQGIGFFVSYNSGGKGEISNRTEIWNKILDRYFPYTPPPASPVAEPKADVQAVSGYYTSSRRSQTNVLKVTSMLGQLKVFPDPDGGIRIDPLKDSAGELIHWQEIGPLLYRQRNGQDLVAFRRDASGKMVLSIDFPFFVFQRATGLDSKPFNVFVFISGASVLLLVLILWPIAHLLRKHYGQKLSFSPRDRRLRFLVKIICAIDIVFILAWVILGSRLDSGVLSESLDPWIHLIQIIGVLGCLGALVAIYNAYRSWSDRERWIWAKLADTFVALACLGLAWFMLAWDLLNFNLNF
jgi:CubicO group peptidase (beta-lactamase class C family)